MHQVDLNPKFARVDAASSGLYIVFARLVMIEDLYSHQAQIEHLFQSGVLVWVESTPRGPAGVDRVILSSAATFSRHLESLCLSMLFSKVGSGKLCSAWIRLVNRMVDVLPALTLAEKLWLDQVACQAINLQPE